MTPHPFISLLVDVRGQMQREQTAWIADLRRQGVKASHPDDGWVGRKASTVSLTYPHFNDGLEVGSLLALGDPKEYRVVRITGRKDRGFDLPTEWSFK